MHTPRDMGPRNIIIPRNPESFLTVGEAYLAATNADKNPDDNHVPKESTIIIPLPSSSNHRPASRCARTYARTILGNHHRA